MTKKMHNGFKLTTLQSGKPIRGMKRITDPVQWITERADCLSYVKIFKTVKDGHYNYSHCCICFTPLGKCPVFRKLVLEQKVSTEVREEIGCYTDRTAYCEGCEGECYDKIEFVLDCASSKIEQLLCKGCSMCSPFRLNRHNLSVEKYHEWRRCR